MAANPHDQAAYLASVDPDFKSASSEDQAGYLAHITGKDATAAPQIPEKYGFTPENLGHNLLEGAKGAASSIYDVGKDLLSNPNWVQGPTSTLNKYIVPPMEREVVKAGNELNDPNGSKLAAAGHILASSVPLVGPWAASIGEQAGTGDVGGATAQAAPAALAAATPKILGEIGEAMPSAKLERAGVAFQKAKAAAGPAQIDVTNPGNVALNIQRLSESGGAMPKVIRDFVKRSTDPNKPPLTYSEARDFYSNATRLSADEQMRLTPTMKRQVGEFTRALGKSIQDTAAQSGVGKEHASAMRGYAGAKRLENQIEGVKGMAWDAAKKAIPAAGAAYAAKKIIDQR